MAQAVMRYRYAGRSRHRQLLFSAMRMSDKLRHGQQVLRPDSQFRRPRYFLLFPLYLSSSFVSSFFIFLWSGCNQSTERGYCLTFVACIGDHWLPFRFQLHCYHRGRTRDDDRIKKKRRCYLFRSTISIFSNFIYFGRSCSTIWTVGIVNR